MSLLFNTLSRFVRAFLPRGKHLLISRLQSLSIIILEPKKIKSVTGLVSYFTCLLPNHLDVTESSNCVLSFVLFAGLTFMLNIVLMNVY